MILQKKNGVLFYQFPNLADFSDISHGIFTRNGGYSKNSYKELNVSFGIGDNENNVRQNRSLISQCMKGKELVFINQNHGTDALVLKKESTPGPVVAPDKPLTGDAMITDILHKCLVIQVADCQAVLMYDPVRRVVANVHSGWRGSINNIIGLTIKVMKKKFGCIPSDIITGIGPSLGPCCAEFINYKKEIPATFWKYRDDSNHFDFWSLSCDQLCDSGVLFENIYLSRICTKCNTDLFFSYRGEGTTGRFATVIGLR